MAKILISLPQDLLDKLTERCKSESYDRSEFVRKLIREKLFDKDIEIKDNLSNIDNRYRKQEIDDGKPFTPSPAQLNNGNVVSKMYGKLISCPICGQEVYEKLSNQHFVSKHPESQI